MAPSTLSRSGTPYPVTAAELLGAAHEHCGHDEVGQRLEGVADDRRVVLAVDEGEDASHGRRRHLPLDAARVLLVLVRVDGELDDPLLPVKRVTAPDVDVRAVDLDHVVTGARVPAQAQRGDRSRVDDEEVLEPPGVRHVLVTRRARGGHARAAGTRSRRRRRRRRSAPRPVPGTGSRWWCSTKMRRSAGSSANCSSIQV